MSAMSEHIRRATGRIVVGVDGSGPSAAALRWGIDEGERRGIGLTAVACWKLPVIAIEVELAITLDLLERATRESAHDAVRAALGSGAEAADVHIDVLEGSPSLRLLEYGEVAEMVVVGSRGRGGFAGLTLGSVSQHLAEHAHCPVVVVKEPRA
jgi:nucleotide-binding universal stress UspA family protein